MIVAAGGRTVGSARRLTEILSRLDPGDELALELIDTSGPRRVRLSSRAGRPARAEPGRQGCSGALVLDP